MLSGSPRKDKGAQCAQCAAPLSEFGEPTSPSSWLGRSVDTDRSANCTEGSYANALTGTMNKAQVTIRINALLIRRDPIGTGTLTSTHKHSQQCDTTSRRNYGMSQASVPAKTSFVTNLTLFVICIDSQSAETILKHSSSTMESGCNVRLHQLLSGRSWKVEIK